MTIAPRAVHAQIRLPLEEMDLVLRLDRDLDGVVSGAELEAARSRVADYVAGHLHCTADGRPLPLVVGQPVLRQDGGAAYLEVAADARTAPRIASIAIRSDFLTEVDATHQTRAEIRIRDHTEAFVFQPGATFERRLGPDWLTAALWVLAGLVAMAALWLSRRRVALTAALTLVASLASADVIMSAPALNATLKRMERLTREGSPASTFKLGVEADALASLMNQEVESHGMQERALLDLALSRTKELGIAIAYNREKKKFFYDGAAFAEYLRVAPRGPHAAEASFQLLAYQFYQSSATDTAGLIAAAESAKRFLAAYPTSPANAEVRLFLAVDYRDLHRQFLKERDAGNAAKYGALAREACRRIVSQYPRTEQADAARQLLQGLRP